MELWGPLRNFRFLKVILSAKGLGGGGAGVGGNCSSPAGPALEGELGKDGGGRRLPLVCGVHSFLKTTDD